MKLKSLTRKGDRAEIPLIPLRELVVFPHMVVPFFVGRQGSIQAIEEAMNGERTVFLACQKTAADTPSESDIHSAGTVSKILQMLKLPDGTIRVLAEGQERGLIRRFHPTEEGFRVTVSRIHELREISAGRTALMDAVLSTFDKLKKFYKKLTPEAVTSIEKAEFPDKLVDLVCANIPLKTDKKVELLSLTDPDERLEMLAVVLEQELEVLSLQHRIQTKVRKRMEKSQKEYFLNEQMKEIQKELGSENEEADELSEIEKRIKARKPPKEVLDRAQREIKRLAKLQPMSPESGVIRTYLEWISDLPWTKTSKDNHDIDNAARILDEDHYDLKKPKERILDFIAIRQLQTKAKGPILCLVGPPGTGKTSLGRSIARALNREFIRISLGGVRDEAEIRGHRRTYVGALPGKIIQSMRKVGTINPVFLLDEIDKISSDFRGDPASALLEVLDPEQNFSFTDHYLELPFDLSAVMFITTANSVHSIPYPLRDRMEVIEVPGYTEHEKIRIATDFIIPKQTKENGLLGAKITFHRTALMRIIQSYTMESGVRNLEREIASIIRKIAREAVKKGFRPLADETQESSEPQADAAVSTGSSGDNGSGREAEAEIDPSSASEDVGAPYHGNPAAARDEEAAASETSASDTATQQGTADGQAFVPFSATITEKKAERYLGKRKFQDDLVYKDARPGLAHGLAWTETGGTLLPVEVAVIDGNGDLILTGSLGDVMKESARTALSFLRAHCRKFDIPSDFQSKQDIHIHVPEGAIPKDGPSAGITLTAALVSALTGSPVAAGYAMTGEITLTGRILAIGGVKEKVLAAHRNRMRYVLMPEANRKDIAELPKEVSNQITYVFTDSVMEALRCLFPEPFGARATSATTPPAHADSHAGSRASFGARSAPDTDSDNTQERVVSPSVEVRRL